MPPKPRRSRHWTILAVAAALALHWFMAISVSPRVGVTVDEVGHLAAGVTYWKFNDYRLNPENGMLPMRLAALPWLAADFALPPPSSVYWRTSQTNLYGEELFFYVGNPIDTLLWRSRLMIALIGVITVWLTWRWARGLFGPRAGWIALALAVFCPALLAHSGLATSDVAVTACVLAALSLVWRTLHRATWPRVLGAMLLCGCAFLSKMSGVLIVPLIGAMLIVRWLRPAPFVCTLYGTRWLRRRSHIVLTTSALTLGIAAGSLVVLWAGYGFRYQAFNPAIAQENDAFFFSWDAVLDRAPLPAGDKSPLATLLTERLPQRESSMTHLVAWLRDHRLLPEAYLWGFAHTFKFSRYRPAYFRGEYRTTGWKLFFPAAFVMKTTLPALALIAAGALALASRRVRRSPRPRGKPWLYRAAPLALFFVVYWAMAIQMSLNIGHRHILPTYPVFYVIAAGAALWIAGRVARSVALGIVALLAFHAADSALVRPFYLSYFQPLFGGIDRGYRHLVDSSYDWGQGLPDLARWLEAKKQRGDSSPVFLSYFGADSPQARHLDVTRVADSASYRGPRQYPARLRGGTYVISATHYQRPNLPIRGPWQARHEELYREIHFRLVNASPTPATPAANAALAADAEAYEVLQFGRLCHYLGDRPPDEIVGGSLLVFRLTDAEVAFALQASLAALEQHRARAAAPTGR